jgi:hypothetical protein
MITVAMLSVYEMRHNIKETLSQNFRPFFKFYLIGIMFGKSPMNDF